jgi:hypothetical protein
VDLEVPHNTARALDFNSGSNIPRRELLRRLLRFGSYSDHISKRECVPHCRVQTFFISQQHIPSETLNVAGLVAKTEHPEQEYVVHRVRRDDEWQVFCLAKCNAKDDTGSGREEKLADVCVVRVQSIRLFHTRAQLTGRRGRKAVSGELKSCKPKPSNGKKSPHGR